MSEADLNEFRGALCRSWSVKTSPLWLAENPARGQCNVTALVFNDRFGGDILKTPLGDEWHFYNRVAGTTYDMTGEQFDAPPEEYRRHKSHCQSRLTSPRTDPGLGTARIKAPRIVQRSCQSAWAWSNCCGRMAGCVRRHGYGQTTAQAGGPGTSLREREGARGLVVSGWRTRCCSRSSMRWSATPPSHPCSRDGVARRLGAPVMAAAAAAPTNPLAVAMNLRRGPSLPCPT